jgi:hypothetical protein
MQTDLSFSTAFRISKYSPGDLAEVDILSFYLYRVVRNKEMRCNRKILWRFTAY